jgi:glycosyltransferase involved in cell wall biosynthesis
MGYLVTCDRLFLDAPGGGYRIAWELARLAREEGQRVALLCGSTDRDPAPGLADVEGVRVVRYRFPSAAKLDPRRWTRQVAEARAAFRRELASERWDVVHAHMPVGARAVFPEVPDARRIYTVHSPAALEQRINWDDGTLAGRLKTLVGLPLLARAERRALRSATAVHVLSNFTARELARAHGSAVTGKVARIPWWQDVPPVAGPTREEARRRLGWPVDRPVLFSLRRLVKRMGLDTLIDAAGPLAAEYSFMLALAGDGPERTRLEAQAKRVAVDGSVRFMGRLSDEDLGLAYHACDAFVLPTRALECFGIIVLEAFAHGRPVLASRAGAIPELMEPVLPGWLFEPGDVAGLRGLLREFLSMRLSRPSPDRLVEYVRRGFGRAEITARYRRLLFGPGDEA